MQRSEDESDARLQISGYSWTDRTCVYVCMCVCVCVCICPNNSGGSPAHAVGMKSVRLHMLRGWMGRAGYALSP